MKKVIVIGCPGSGKTTFALKLHNLTGLPLHHLDAIWHKPDRTNIPREEFDRKLMEIFATPEWIIDGNYSRTVEARIKECDTVFLFDLPTDVCLSGVNERLGIKRVDMPWIDTEFDPQLRQTIEEFPYTRLPQIYALLESLGSEKSVTVFKSRTDADDYLARLARECKS